MPQLILNPLVAPPRAQRILVIRLGAVGDVVRTLPAVALLRDALPEARIDWLVEERTAGVIEQRPFVDRAVVFPRAELTSNLRAGRLRSAGGAARDFLRDLRAARYELVLDFHALARSALLAVASGAPRRIGYSSPHAREGAGFLATHRVRLPRARLSRYDRNEALVRAVVGDRAVASTPPLEVASSARESMARQLGVAEAPVVLHPGSSRAALAKRWPAARFGELALRLIEDGARVWVASGPDPAERALARAIVRSTDGGAELAPRTEHFEDLAALLQRARVVVAADSAPLHTAALLGTPVVQLLGPTDPVENAPAAASPSRQVVSDLPCRGCRRGCAAAACMIGIDAERVGAAVAALMEGVGGGDAPERSARRPLRLVSPREGR